MHPHYHPQKENNITPPSLVEERRHLKRVAFSHYVFCCNREQHFLAHGIDLSTQGLSLASNLNPPVGSLWDVSFQLPGEGTSLHGQAMVVRAEERAGSFWALKFVETAPALSNPLQKFVDRQFLLHNPV